MPVIVCFACSGAGGGCAKCAGTGRLFWVYGRTFPCHPHGQLRAMASVQREHARKGGQMGLTGKPDMV